MLPTCESGAPDVLSALSKRSPDHEGSSPCLRQDHQSSLILTYHIDRGLTIVKWTSCVCLAFLKLSLQCHLVDPPRDVLPWYHTLKSSLSIPIILWCRALRSDPFKPDQSMHAHVPSEALRGWKAACTIS